MDPVTAKLMSAAGAAADPVYVDDVFSTFLYEGTGADQTIANGIDLSGEGGMVWIKNRESSDDHYVFDTERGATKYIFTNSSQQEYDISTTLKSFTSTGFTLGLYDGVNRNNTGVCSWTFRKCPGFFDVVTFTGNGSTNGVTVSHGLGSTPGCIIVKSASSSTDQYGSTMDWYVWHRSGPTDSNPLPGVTNAKLGGRLNSSNAFDRTSNLINTVTSTDFKYGSNNVANAPNVTYVAYIFAHDDQSFGDDGNEAIIKCGSYTGNSTNTGNAVNLGFEPQWLLVKNSSSSGYTWILLDTMRGIVNGGNDPSFYTTSSQAEDPWNSLELTPTGFNVTSSGSAVNNSGDTYIYIAIRRPHKPPSAGTDVFAVDSRGSTGDGNEPTYRSGFPVDMQFNRNVTYAGGNMQISARLTQGKQMHTNLTGQESTSSVMMFDYMNGVQTDTGTGSNQYAWMFKRAPGFFDVVTYTGTGSARTVNHNLGVAPELMIVKQRDGGSYWAVYSSALGATKYLQLNGNNAEGTSVAVWNNTSPTSSVFTVNYAGAVNGSGNEYIAYLFASLDGISKIGTYTGTGSARNLDFGFTAGARFFLYKRTDDSQNWVLFDTGRGITAGTDYGIPLNEYDAQFSGDYVDPYSAGISLTGSVANNSGATFIYLAIA